MSEFRNCPFCGKLISEDAMVCKHCGKPLQINKSSSSFTINIDFFRIVAVFILILCFLYGFKKGIDSSPNNISLKTDSAIEKNNVETAKSTNNTNKTNYKMKSLDTKVINYINRKGLANKLDNDKKNVLYSKVIGLNCPYQNEFLRVINTHQNNKKWLEKYNFIEMQHQQRETIAHNDWEEYEQEIAFRDVCDLFCIIDWKNKTVFDGSSDHKFKSERYVHNVLNTFYNE